jgi:hypothetical protein
MNNKETFENLCRYIWRDNPHDFIAVRVNPETTNDGLRNYRFAAPDNGEISGVVSISEVGLMQMAKKLGYAGVRIIRQRGKQGRFVIPDPDQMERDALLDY